MMNFDAVTGAIGKAVKFFDEKILPKAKVFYEDMKETTIGVFDGLFEKDKGLFPLIGKGLAEIRDGFKEDDPEKKLKGMKTIFVDGTIKTISECLADEVINAARGSSNSFAINSRDYWASVLHHNMLLYPLLSIVCACERLFF